MDENLHKRDWDLTLCGEAFTFSSGKCSSLLVYVCPSYFLLTLFSAAYMGKQYAIPFTVFHRSWNVRIKMVLVFILIFCPIIIVLISYFLNIPLFLIDYINASIQSFCWLIHIGYLSLLPLPKSRGHCFVNILYILCTSTHGYNLYIIVVDGELNPIVKYAVIVSYVIQVLYIGTCIPKFMYRHSLQSPLVINSSEGYDPLIDLVSSGATYRDETNPHVLGVAEESGILSKLFLCWVRPLMVKGFHQLVKTSVDLFELPMTLRATYINAKVQDVIRICSQSFPIPHADLRSVNDPLIAATSASTANIPSTSSSFHNFSLLLVLHRCFGLEYYMIGTLQFFSDCLAFSGPVLLNLLVTFLEDGRKSYDGYLYALGLFIVTLISALSTTHYGYLVNRMGLKVKSAMILAIYQKTLNISKSTLSSFSTGEIVDFMSTDTDRVVNFCPSFHQFWSLPFQIAITLYLLYTQIGFSFLIGLVFAIIVIPINQLIAKKIGTYSKFMMEEKDKRIKLMSEILSGMKVIKMQAWETTFSEKIKRIRQKEINYLKKRKYLDALCVYFWATTPVVVSFLSFTIYVLMGNELTASRIFTSIALFNLLIVPLNAFPWVLNGLVEAYISMKRIEALLKLPELELDDYYSNPLNDDIKLEIRDGVFSNSMLKSVSAEKAVVTEAANYKELLLGPLNISVLKGKFICIVGKVGSGKSTILSAVLADITRVAGSIYISALDRENGFGLVPQEPWIMQTSIRENILFGKTMEHAKYKTILEACALFHDLKILPFGDLTEVGEKGITLSGGQKARIALARAVYQDLDLYLLDDPLAAVDVHIGEHLLTKCVMGLLQNKTRVMCTHRMNVASKADLIIVLEDGKISMQGPPNNFLQHQLIMSFEENIEECHVEQKNDLSETNRELNIENLEEENDITPDEEKDSGELKFHVYLSYWNAVGSKLAIFVLLSCLVMQGSKTISDWWLSYWIHENSQNGSHVNDTSSLFEAQIIGNASEPVDSVKYYLSVYGGIAAANSVFTLLRAFSFAYCGITAAVILQSKLLECIFQAPLSFFCVTPIGRILNRFSSDVYNIDDSLPFMLNIFLAQFFALCGCLVVTCYSLPFMVTLFIPLLIGYYYIQRYYRRTSRELKRISSVTLSPIYAHFSETLSGQSTIRALGASARFKKQNMEKLDSFQKASFAIMATSQWLNLQLQFIGVLVVSGVALVALLQNNFSHIDPGLVGLALSYALSLTGLLNGVVTSFTETEKELVSVERVMQYVNNIPHEQDDSIVKPFSTWPSEGVIEFKDVYMQYKADAPHALQNISFKTRPAEKLGIIGRTGSGKSSLIQALFRMVDICHGQIWVDDIEISSIRYQELRSRLSVVPQDPFLFSGSIRENLDPDNVFTDSEICKALENCHMLDKVRSLGGLESEVDEGGRNFSVGERQLISLARVLLHRAKILCLDEATANIDHKTDALLQHTLRMAFRRTTILIIAHRIETIMDCDRVMVIRNGQVLEIDEPSVLLHNHSSEFYKLVHGLQ